MAKKKVHFGRKTSPYLLIPALKYHLKSLKTQHLFKGGIVAGCLYVNNLLTGAKNQQEALYIYLEYDFILNPARKTAKRGNNWRISEIT
ncbi:hypothetical protein HPB48_012951 [Haemaphysalis longicornis]|uniref:Uncharacterized protein n=1 Tax=Haemaphysalis longicornis TaxID=44386 RepID=A0A9J6GHB2_HAELO|nr:hypothetical protein HPB48_012951 [Haemaphysalis longicornis]